MKIYKSFGLTEDEFRQHRYALNTSHTITVKEPHQCRILYFDGDDGVAVFTKPAEIFDKQGFSMQLYGCLYCDVSTVNMLEIVHTLDAFEVEDEDEDA